MKTPVTRRRFLQRSLATSAACSVLNPSKGGLARATAADDRATDPSTSTDSIIDTHVYVSHWPHAELPNSAPAELIATLKRNQVSQAWTGSFDGLFHKDIGTVNQRLVETCTKQGDGILVPFGTVNPTLPDWEEDIRRCHETFHMPGIRLHPNYHGYTLDDPRFARLLELATARGLIVQLVAWMDDGAHKWLTPHTAQVDLKPLAKIVAGLPKLRLVIANGFRDVDDEVFRSLVASKQVYFDIARVNDAQVHKLIGQVAAERLVFGSSAPLHSVETTRAKLNVRGLNEVQRGAIANGTAAKLVSRR